MSWRTGATVWKARRRICWPATKFAGSTSANKGCTEGDRVITRFARGNRVIGRTNDSFLSPDHLMTLSPSSGALWLLIVAFAGWAAVTQTPQFVVGLIVGSLYALAAVGLTLIYGVARV